MYDKEISGQEFKYSNLYMDVYNYFKCRMFCIMDFEIKYREFDILVGSFNDIYKTLFDIAITPC